MLSSISVSAAYSLSVLEGVAAVLCLGLLLPWQKNLTGACQNPQGILASPQHTDTLAHSLGGHSVGGGVVSHGMEQQCQVHQVIGKLNSPLYCAFKDSPFFPTPRLQTMKCVVGRLVDNCWCLLCTLHQLYVLHITCFPL